MGVITDLMGMGTGKSEGIAGKARDFINKRKKKRTKSDSSPSSSDSGGSGEIPDAVPSIAHRGAKIRKGGKIHVLKGERVLNRGQAKNYGRKRSSGRRR